MSLITYNERMVIRFDQNLVAGFTPPSLDNPHRIVALAQKIANGAIQGTIDGRSFIHRTVTVQKAKEIARGGADEELLDTFKTLFLADRDKARAHFITQSLPS